MAVKRYDRLEIRNDVFETIEGYLKGRAVVTRTGVFTYVNEDGSLRKELRHPDHVFIRDSLNTMKMIPMTLRHPTVFVDSTNTDSLSVGTTGETVEPDGKLLIISLVINRQDAIDAVLKNGVLELSLGYEVDLLDEPGEYNGERYDFVQTNIRYNHLAIVDKARAGSVARIKLDGIKDCAIQRLDSENTDNNNNPKKQEKKQMAKFNIDGQSVDVDNIDVAATHFNSMSNKMDETIKKVDTMQGNIDSLTENVGTEKIRADKAEADLVTANETIKTRKDAEDLKVLTESVLPIMGKEYKLDGKDIQEVQKDVIMKVYPNAKLDGKSNDYINGRFDTALETSQNTDGIQGQRQEINMSVNNDSVNRHDVQLTGDKVEDSKIKLDSVYTNAYKNPDILNSGSAEIAYSKIKN